MTTQLERDEANRGKGNWFHFTDVRAIEDMTGLHVVEGYVWCSKEDDVHSDTLNPHGYTAAATNIFCTPEDHQALFMDSDHNVLAMNDPIRSKIMEDKMGHPTSDEDPGSFTSGLTPGGSCRVEPEPVRSNPVPLTVRRHTEESMAIWKANLLAALPQDMLVEDRDRIADALLATTIEMGNTLRRKRLIDKLMEAAEYLEDRATLPNKKNWPESKFQEWSDLLADAAEEIRSVL